MQESTEQPEVLMKVAAEWTELIEVARDTMSQLWFTGWYDRSPSVPKPNVYVRTPSCTLPPLCHSSYSYGFCGQAGTRKRFTHQRKGTGSSSHTQG